MNGIAGTEESEGDDRELLLPGDRSILGSILFILRGPMTARTRATLAILACGLFFARGYPQESDSTTPHLYYPAPLQLWQWESSLGLTVATLPQDIVEEEINQSPALDIHSRLGFPLGFSLDGRLVTQVLTNHATLGAKWSHAFGRFAFSIGDDIAWWFGFLAVEGFDNNANGWLNYPNLSIGYDAGQFRLALKAEALLVLSFTSYAGENVISSNRNTFGGFSLAFVVEQPFWKSTHVTLGLKTSFLRFFYQSWFTYETFNRYLFIPELFMGFLL
jgi:hypothetical protein